MYKKKSKEKKIVFCVKENCENDKHFTKIPNNNFFFHYLMQLGFLPFHCQTNLMIDFKCVKILYSFTFYFIVSQHKFSYILIRWHQLFSKVIYFFVFWSIGLVVTWSRFLPIFSIGPFVTWSPFSFPGNVFHLWGLLLHDPFFLSNVFFPFGYWLVVTWFSLLFFISFL